MEVSFVVFEDLLHHIGCCSAWDVFVEEEYSICFLEGFEDDAVDVEW